MKAKNSDCMMKLELIRFRIDHRKKDVFASKCAEQKLEMSEVLRGFIDDFIGVEK